MKVILLEDVPKIGKAGTVKEVKQGYGFNYLLPEGKASLVTASALRTFEKKNAKAAEMAETAAEQSKKKAAALSEKSFALMRPAENGKLFGSVTKEELSRELASQGYAVEADEIILEKAIKKVGAFSVSADFGNGCKAKFSVHIEAETK